MESQSKGDNIWGKGVVEKVTSGKSGAREMTYSEESCAVSDSLITSVHTVISSCKRIRIHF